MLDFPFDDDRAESLARRLEDLEDAYGETIRFARQQDDCSDIAVNEDGFIWVTVQGEAVNTGHTMTENALRRIVNIVADIDGHPITKAALNANLPTGERFAALLPPTVKRITISIRIPPKRIYTLDEYLDAGIITGPMRYRLKEAVEGRENILVAGGTGAGKTTLANALLAETAFVGSRTCIIQDQDELKCSGMNVVRAFTGQMDARELVKEFLRHNPDRLFVCELRDGGTADEWIGACNTGHPGGLSTIHANSAQEALTRISTLIGKVVKNVPYLDIAQAIDLVVFVRGKGKKRRVEMLIKPTDWDGKRFTIEDAEEDTQGDTDD